MYIGNQFRPRVLNEISFTGLRNQREQRIQRFQAAVSACQREDSIFRLLRHSLQRRRASYQIARGVVDFFAVAMAIPQSCIS